MGQCGSCCSIEPREFIDEPEQQKSSRGDRGERIDEVYQLDCGGNGILGHSSIGAIVKICHRQSRTLRAVKQINKRSIEGVAWKEEIETIRELDHPHICKLHDTWEDSVNVYLIMELCKGGNLTKLSALKDEQSCKSTMNESIMAALVWQMADAVHCLHSHHVMHSDVKLENWLFEDEVTADTHPSKISLKMIDFGFASKFRHGRTRRPSREFAALEASASSKIPGQENKRKLTIATESTLFCKSPEQMGFSEHEPSEKVDVWALGVIAYFLLSGQPPFNTAEGSTDAALFKSATFVFMPPEIWRPISAEAKHFIAMCLQSNPAARPTAAKALQLPWMTMAKSAAHELQSTNNIGAIIRRPPGAAAAAAAARAGRASAMMDGGVSHAALDLAQPSLPSAPKMLTILDRMSRLHVCEKAAIITTARCLSASKFDTLRLALESKDKLKEGVLSIESLFEELETVGVPMDDLRKVLQDVEPKNSRDSRSSVVIHYSDFMASVSEFQQNLQENAAWSVFRSFDTADGDGVPRRDLRAALGEGKPLRDTMIDNFPQLQLDAVLQELGEDAEQDIDFESFKKVLRTVAAFSRQATPNPNNPK